MDHALYILLDSVPSNYRRISFGNCVEKIFAGVINERLEKWSTKHKIVTEYQAGFRKGHSTVDNLYNLAAIVNLKKFMPFLLILRLPSIRYHGNFLYINCMKLGRQQKLYGL